VPGSSEQIAEALFEGALFREKTRGGSPQMALDFIDDLEPRKHSIHAEWESARDREQASRSRFAQHALSPAAVAEELQSVRTAIGRNEDVARFFKAVLQAANVPARTQGNSIAVSLSNEVPRALRQAIGRDESFAGRFDLPLQEGEIYLGRTSPVVEGLASWVLDQALDPVARDALRVASRCGVIASTAVSARTTLLIARFRYHLHVTGSEAETLLCEEIVPLACTGAAENPTWVPADEAEKLLAARPERNLIQTAIDQQLELTLPALPQYQTALASLADARANAQLATHDRVRESSRRKGRVTVEAVLPVDILGAFLLLPMPR